MIIIQPWARRLRNGKTNPKNYPYWKELIELIQKEGQTIVQIGQPDEDKLVDDFRTINSMDELKELINTCDTWIGIDSFFQHFAWKMKKKGIVLFGPSNPIIFGHTENINLYGGKKYFRPDQFGIWETCECNDKAFTKPKDVMEQLRKLLKE